MVQVASHLGGFLPGAEPKYLVPGSALHICGTYRAGELSGNTTTTYNTNNNNNTTIDQYSDYNNGYASSDYWNNAPATTATTPKPKPKRPPPMPMPSPKTASSTRTRASGASATCTWAGAA